MQNRIKRFDRIVSSLQEKGNEVKGESISFSFDERYKENSRINERHAFGTISRLTLDIDRKNDCVSITLDADDIRGDFLLQKCKGKLTVTERFVAYLGQDPETGLWIEDEVELDIEPEDSVLDALLDAAERLAERKTD